MTWLYREVSAPFLFFSAQWNPAIRWRSKEFKLNWGGVATESSLEGDEEDEDGGKTVKEAAEAAGPTEVAVVDSKARL